MPVPRLEIVDLRTTRDEELLTEIYDGLYRQSFPFEEEREDLDFWRENLWDSKPGSLVVHFLVAGRGLADGEAREVAGFIGSEYYPESHVGLVTYIAVAEEWRGQGVGRKLMDAAFDRLSDDARAAGHELGAVFAEIHEPTQIAANSDAIPPRDRVAIMARYGARRVPIPYVQPALGEGRKRAYGLMLVAFPHREKSVDTIRADTVGRFLRELYADDMRDDDRDLARMLNALNGDVELEDLVDEEDPALPGLAEYGIAFHFAAWNPAPVEMGASSVEIDSFERDILSYAYRDARRPLRSHVDLRPTLRRLTVRFPPHVSFVSEGRPVTLLRARVSDERRVELRIARTDFASRLSILHLVLNPSPDGGASALNEYELIKLAKFWEGGEGVDEPAAAPTDTALFTVGVEGGEETTLLKIAQEAVDGAELTPLRAGTIQVLVGDSEAVRLCKAVMKLKEREGAARLSPAVRRQVTALGGVLQGLLDFEEVDLDELADVFKDVEMEDVRIDSIKKGTLFSLANRDRGFEAAEALGVSPYLLIPHAVLLHNEALLKRALRIATELTDPVNGRPSVTKPREVVSWYWRNRLIRLERDRREIARLLNDVVPNVFHYEEEQALYEQGWKSRSLDSLKGDVESRVKELGIDIDKRHTRLRDIAGHTIAVLLLGFSAVQTASKINPAIVYPIYAIVGLIYLGLILRR